MHALEIRFFLDLPPVYLAKPMVVTYAKVHLECILSRVNEPTVHLVCILLELSLLLDMLRLPP